MLEEPARICLKAVSKKYHRNGLDVNALDRVSLEFDQGRFYTIEGPSGAGKSTLLAIIGCLSRPDSGGLFFDRSDLAQWSLRRLNDIRKALIGHVYEKDNLLSALTVAENVALVLRIANGRERRAAIRQAQRHLELLGLVQLADHKPAQLSSGELKRIGVVRALIKNPFLLLLDEPTANLDGGNAEVVARTLSEFHAARDGITIAVTHDPAIMQLADAHFRLEQGRLTKPE